MRLPRIEIKVSSKFSKRLSHTTFSQIRSIWRSAKITCSNYRCLSQCLRLHNKSRNKVIKQAEDLDKVLDVLTSFSRHRDFNLLKQHWSIWIRLLKISIVYYLNPILEIAHTFGRILSHLEGSQIVSCQFNHTHIFHHLLSVQEISGHVAESGYAFCFLCVNWYCLSDWGPFFPFLLIQFIADLFYSFISCFKCYDKTQIWELPKWLEWLLKATPF